MAVWVDAFKVGDLVAHPVYGERAYSQPQLEQAIVNFRKLRAQGYTHTVLREHGREDSFVYGNIEDVRVMNGYFQTKIDFYRADERQAYNEGILREFSPGFADEWLDPHTGETLNNVLIEISFTSRAYQRNLRAPQDINPGVQLSDLGSLHAVFSGHLLTTGGPMADEEQPVEAPEAEESEAVETEEEEKTEFSVEEALNAGFTSLSAMIQTLSDALMPKEEQEEPVAMSDDQTRIHKLETELADMKAANTRLELSAKGIPAERVDDLVQLSAKLTKAEFNKVVEYSRPTTVQAEIGATGLTEAGAQDTPVSKIVEMAAEAGATYGAGKLTLWLHKNGFGDRAEEIIQAARH